jgi:hypothetical protein
MSTPRWFIVTAPDGAARTLAANTTEALSTLLGPQQCKEFDTLRYRTAFEQLLKQPDPDMVIDLLNQALIVACLDFKATVCLVTALSPVTLFSLNILRRCGVQTVHWFTEDMHKATYWNEVLSGYDHFFAIQHGNIESASCERGAHYHYLPVATGCARYPYAETTRPWDLLFIGIPSSYRVQVLEKLVTAGYKIAIAGTNWHKYRGILEPSIIKSTWIDDREAFHLMQQAKIGLNLAFDNPASRTDVHISPRAYDLLAAGCLLLTEANPLLSESLHGCTCTTFTSIDDAPAKAATLLSAYAQHDAERAANRAAVLSQHRYLDRAEMMVKLVG